MTIRELLEAETAKTRKEGCGLWLNKSAGEFISWCEDVYNVTMKGCDLRSENVLATFEGRDEELEQAFARCLVEKEG